MSVEPSTAPHQGATAHAYAPIEVRVAVPEDAVAIMGLCRGIHAEIGLFPFDQDKIDLLLRRAWAKDHVVFLVIGPVGNPVACLALFLGEAWYSRHQVLEELFLFVDPGHRRSGYTRALLRAAKAVSTGLHLPVLIGVSSTDRLDAKARLYGRELRRCGINFMFNEDLIAGGPARSGKD